VKAVQELADEVPFFGAISVRDAPVDNLAFLNVEALSGVNTGEDEGLIRDRACDDTGGNPGDEQEDLFVVSCLVLKPDNDKEGLLGWEADEEPSSRFGIEFE